MGMRFHSPIRQYPYPSPAVPIPMSVGGGFKGVWVWVSLQLPMGYPCYSLSMKQCIRTGLGIAGTSNTFKTVSYNSILSIILFFAASTIQQFCLFDIVLLVAHWFLIQTFFVAVQSIDLQRLEVCCPLLLPFLYTLISVLPLPVERHADARQGLQTQHPYHYMQNL